MTTDNNYFKALDDAIAKELAVSVKNVYGKDTVYPECDTSKLLAQLSGHRTLTGDAISILKNLGYTFAPITKEI